MPTLPGDTATGAAFPWLSRRKALTIVLLGWGVGASSHAQAARLGLTPIISDGMAGRVSAVSGTEFLPSTTFTVTFRGTPVFPSTVASDAAGAIALVTCILPALPAGPQDVVLTGGGRVYTFVGAFQVFRNICLSPTQGAGRNGLTYYDPPGGGLSGLTGAWTGMVTVIEGWGFASAGVIAANSITVGGAATHHPQINVSATGRLASTTIIVQSNLSGGRKDIVIDDGAAITFAGVYTIQRRIGSYPSRGTNTPAATSTIFLVGYGFDDVSIAANSITVNGATTAHPAITPVNGAFTLTLTLTGTPTANAGPLVAQGEVFTNGYDAVAPTSKMIGLSLSTMASIHNHAIEVEGMGNLVAGSIAANSIVLQETGADVSTTHPAFTVANGRFPRMFIKVNSSCEGRATALSVFDGAGGGAARTDARGIEIRPTLCLCPIYGTGRPGFTVSITGFGFGNSANVAANTITIGTARAVHPAINETIHGEVPITLVVMSATMSGPLDVSITDSAGRTGTWPVAFHVLRTIGLTYVNGTGTAGELTALSGNGFTGGAAATMPANSLVIGSATTHPAITVTGTGSFLATPVVLPALATGAWDVVLPPAQAGQVFSQAYRVTPMITASKYVSPPASVSGTVVTFSISYTNTGIGDFGANVSILDTIPAGMTYAPGSAASSLAATIDWFSSLCTCFTAVEPPPANVLRVRWTLTNPLPLGASGIVSFKVTVN